MSWGSSPLPGSCPGAVFVWRPPGFDPGRRLPRPLHARRAQPGGPGDGVLRGRLAGGRGGGGLIAAGRIEPILIVGRRVHRRSDGGVRRHRTPAGPTCASWPRSSKPLVDARYRTRPGREATMDHGILDGRAHLPAGPRPPRRSVRRGGLPVSCLPEAVVPAGGGARPGRDRALPDLPGQRRGGPRRRACSPAWTACWGSCAPRAFATGRTSTWSSIRRPSTSKTTGRLGSGGRSSSSSARQGLGYRAAPRPAGAQLAAGGVDAAPPGVAQGDVGPGAPGLLHEGPHPLGRGGPVTGSAGWG